MHLAASDPEGERSIDLFLVPEKPYVLNGDRGYSRKSEESPLLASYYFSCTDLKTEGLLSTGGHAFRVTGKSWFDREISSRGLGKGESGWDWFALQLEDGREIMLYRMRRKDGSIDAYSSGTLVYKDGKSRHLAREEFTVKVLDHYRSEKTGARYPSKWEIAILPEKLSLVVTPMIRDQEFLARNSTGNYYWEGAARVEGAAKGRAYVEMTGY
jgi:predicted secreted hydrolase